jgi:hypothetical protein
MTTRFSKELKTRFINKYFREPYRKRQKLIQYLHQDCQALYNYQFGNKRPRSLFWEDALGIRKNMIRMYDDKFEINIPWKLTSNELWTSLYVVRYIHTKPFDGIRHYRMYLQDLYNINAGELTQKINKKEAEYLVIKSKFKREYRIYQRQFRSKGYCRCKVNASIYRKQGPSRKSRKSRNIAKLENKRKWFRRDKQIRYRYNNKR